MLYRNFKAGSLTTDEHYLKRAGLRGRKIALCYLLVVGMLLFSLGHLMVCTFYITSLCDGIHPNFNGPTIAHHELMYPDSNTDSFMT